MLTFNNNNLGVLLLLTTICLSSSEPDATLNNLELLANAEIDYANGVGAGASVAPAHFGSVSHDMHNFDCTVSLEAAKTTVSQVILNTFEHCFSL